MLNALQNINNTPPNILVLCGDDFIVKSTTSENGQQLPDGDYQLYSKCSQAILIRL
jgi:hypothetical protein